MKRDRHCFLLILGSLPLLIVPAPARADAGDKIVRGGLAYAIPSDDLEWGGPAQTDFMDPRFPPLGRFDSLEEHLASADSGFELGIRFEYGLTDLVGIDTNFNFSRHDGTTVFSGEITFTPAIGDPPALNPEQSQHAPIIGVGDGQASLFTLTVGANLHVLRRKAVDIHFGPVVGLAVLSSELTSGGFTASFPSFVSATPVESVDWKRRTHDNVVVGAFVGVDVPFGTEGWMLSIPTKCLLGSISPMERTARPRPPVLTFGVSVFLEKPQRRRHSRQAERSAPK
ncbi:MAG: hypothetical protein ACE5JI_19550 [Acidobacteriota bacterium]